MSCPRCRVVEDVLNDLQTHGESIGGVSPNFLVALVNRRQRDTEALDRLTERQAKPYRCPSCNAFHAGECPKSAPSMPSHTAFLCDGIKGVPCRCSAEVYCRQCVRRLCRACYGAHWNLDHAVVGQGAA